MFSVVLVFSMLSLGCILISDLLVGQSAHVFTSRYDSTLLGYAFFTPKVFLDDIIYCVTIATGSLPKTVSNGECSYNIMITWADPRFSERGVRKFKDSAAPEAIRICFVKHQNHTL